MTNLIEVKTNGIGTDIWQCSTPNILAYQFVMPNGMNFMQGRAATFGKKPHAAGKSPLAAELLSVEGVTQVVLGSHEGEGGRPENRRDYVTITFSSAVYWEKWKTLIYSKLAREGTTKSFFATAGAFAVTKSIPDLVQEFRAASKSPEEAVIKAIIVKTNERMAAHGGNIKFDSYDKSTGRLNVVFEENCAGCSSADGTVRGLKQLLDLPDLNVRVTQINLVKVPAGISWGA